MTLNMTDRVENEWKNVCFHSYRRGELWVIFDRPQIQKAASVLTVFNLMCSAAYVKVCCLVNGGREGGRSCRGGVGKKRRRRRRRRRRRETSVESV